MIRLGSLLEVALLLLVLLLLTVGNQVTACSLAVYDVQVSLWTMSQDDLRSLVQPDDDDDDSYYLAAHFIIGDGWSQPATGNSSAMVVLPIAAATTTNDNNTGTAINEENTRQSAAQVIPSCHLKRPLSLGPNPLQGDMQDGWALD